MTKQNKIKQLIERLHTAAEPKKSQKSTDYASNLQIWHAHQNPVLGSILVSIQGKDWTKVEGALKFNALK